ncbi:hypothetical protein [Nitrosomonas communis]|uniref:hypothetical protein n=1 Tax=Nitrosomonas communis TaxID=44574 RepID=UPI0011152980|nr:hypothetical protein [Nitrosomonas communis]
MRYTGQSPDNFQRPALRRFIRFHSSRRLAPLVPCLAVAGGGMGRGFFGLMNLNRGVIGRLKSHGLWHSTTLDLAEAIYYAFCVSKVFTIIFHGNSVWSLSAEQKKANE